MTSEELARIVAAKRRAAVESLLPTRQAARLKIDELQKARQEERAQAHDRQAEREIVSGHPFDLFPTPEELADRMVSIAAEIHPQTWLEPSAGTGRIADAIKRAGFYPDCIELNHSAAELLKKHGHRVTCADFLETNSRADAIVMNPPFSNGQDIKHVRHAAECLNPGGRIVAIMSDGSFCRSDKAAREFQEWMTPHKSEQLPPGTFKTSGTLVNCRLIVIDAYPTHTKTKG